MKIGFIGLGNMGASLAQAVAQQIPSEDLLLANRSPEKVEAFIAQFGGCAASTQELLKEVDLVFLGVKPHQIGPLLQENQALLQERSPLILVSMAAGLNLDTLSHLTSSHHRWIRIMPNTPVEIGAGVISLALNEQTQAEDVQVVLHLLEKAGKVYQMEEAQMDAATALAGCGPAFVYLFIEALADAGVKTGLPRQVAQAMAAQTVQGAAQMVLEKDQHPGVLKDQVCSPGGSTIAGVASLEANAFRGSVIAAVDAAFQRNQDLGN